MCWLVTTTTDRQSDVSARPDVNASPEVNASPAEVAPFAAAPSGYRLPAQTELGVVRLQVANLVRSIEYYERVLGLRLLHESPVKAVLSAAADGRALVELNELPGAKQVPRRGLLGLYHFAVLLPDRASIARFVTHLFEIGEYAGMSDHLVSEAVYLTDPDGLGIEVYADRPRASWHMEGDALAMATLPLDLDDLIPAGAGARWDGAPAGTRIGHVHLYVSDLERSAAFFHEGLGLDRIVLNFPGALFMSAGGYHHHLGTNTWAASAPAATASDARLLEWTVRVPTAADAKSAGESIARAGFDVAYEKDGVIATDPWGTKVRVTDS
jgi:catechol 2,3-dioxygenase